MAQIVTTVGIDVSKDRLDVCIGPADEQFSVTNDPAGWRQLVRRLQPLMARAIGLEASGGYERGAIDALLEAGLPVRLVNPWKLRKFAQAFGVLAKNDRLDARVIAQFVASALKPPADVAPMERRPRPCLPAAFAPVGETWLATAISTLGRE